MKSFWTNLSCQCHWRRHVRAIKVEDQKGHCNGGQGNHGGWYHVALQLVEESVRTKGVFDTLEGSLSGEIQCRGWGSVVGRTNLLTSGTSGQLPLCNVDVTDVTPAGWSSFLFLLYIKDEHNMKQSNKRQRPNWSAMHTTIASWRFSCRCA